LQEHEQTSWTHLFANDFVAFNITQARAPDISRL
jgi:hypothetical protein